MTVFEKPSVDACEYRYLELKNGVRALLVRDPEADKAAAACDVRVGSLADPDDVPGLAHFLEHMLFYSSEKYPEEDSYSKYVSDYGGMTNAYTANESTNYHFDVNWEALPEGLDRFAQFFICPLISPNGVEREAKAVDSEHGKNLNSDPWMALQLWKLFSKPGHVFGRFATGNYETLITKPTKLGMSPHDTVVDFYESHYSANLMTVVVLSRHSLDELEGMVKEKFEGIRNKGYAPMKVDEDCLVEGKDTGILIKTVPQKDGHTVDIQWGTLSEEEHYRRAPSNFLSHLLGHEGKGSVFEALKENGLAHSLSAGEAATSFSSRSFFSCKIELTDAGHEHIKHVLGIVFEYLDLVRHVLRNDVDKAREIFDEIQSLARLRFNYREKMNAYSFVSSLAHAMQVYTIEDLLLAMYHVPFEYDKDLILRELDDLVPSNARIMWSSKTLIKDCTENEAWYGTPYHVETIPQDWLDSWVQSGSRDAVGPYTLVLPDRNDFIPSDFCLVDTLQETPILVSENECSTLWVRLDPSFKLPKAALFIQFHLPEAYNSPVSALLTSLMVKLVNDALNEETYPAQLAGLHYSLRSNQTGIALGLNGYHHTLGRLAELVTTTLINLPIQEVRFDFVLQKLKKEYQNLRFEQPYRLAMYELDVALESKKWHVNDYLAVIDDLTVEMLREFVPRIFKTCKIVALSSGNLSQDVSENILLAIENMMKTRHSTRPPRPSQLSESRIIQLLPGKSPVIPVFAPNPENDNDAVVIAFQGFGPESGVKLQLLSHLGKREAFYQLRTIEQLGYIVFFASYKVQTITNLIILVQSTSYGASDLDARVQNFLPNLRDKLKNLSDTEFSDSVEELIKSKLEKPKRLRQKASKDWAEIEDGTLKFDRDQIEVDVLRQLSKSSMIEFYEKEILNENTRRMIRIHMKSLKTKEENSATIEEEKIMDVFQWKRNQPLYPCALDTL